MQPYKKIQKPQVGTSKQCVSFDRLQQANKQVLEMQCFDTTIGNSGAKSREEQISQQRRLDGDANDLPDAHF